MIQRVTECYIVLQSVTECYRVLQSVTEFYRVLQSVTECFRVLEGITKTNLAHLLGPIFGFFPHIPIVLRSGGKSKNFCDLMIMSL